MTKDNSTKGAVKSEWIKKKNASPRELHTWHVVASIICHFCKACNVVKGKTSL